LAKSPNPDDIDLTHVQVGYEAMGMDDGDIYGMTVLGVLLGGGGSFSAGGVKH
jgi:processing peptidase subunit alpha